MRSALVADLLDRCWFPEPTTLVDCAVSGGADSLALLILAAEAGCVATAVHVDHGMRDGSAGESALVADVARELGCRFRAVSVHVEAGPNLEARAREARYGVLPAGALLGHTADDQAETVVLNMLRGAGPTGLAGMRRTARRPMLDLRRADTEALCAAYGVEPFVDPSNADPAFRRNRVRSEVLPLLADVGGRDVVPLLLRQAAQHRAIEEVLDALSAAIDATDVVALRSHPELLARTALRRWLREQTGAPYGPDTASLDRVMTVVEGSAVAAEVAGFGRVSRSAGRLSLTPR